MRTPRPVFWIEILLAVVSGISTVMTVLWRDWIEILFGMDPDHGNGSVEWLIVVASLAVTVVLSMLARREWRRAAAAEA